MTFEEFENAAMAYHANHPEQRVGQALVNVLTFNRPEILRHMEIDIWENNYVTAQERLDVGIWLDDVAYLW